MTKQPQKGYSGENLTTADIIALAYIMSDKKPEPLPPLYWSDDLAEMEIKPCNAPTEEQQGEGMTEQLQEDFYFNRITFAKKYIEVFGLQAWKNYLYMEHENGETKRRYNAEHNINMWNA